MSTFCSNLDTIAGISDEWSMTRYPGGKGRCYQRIISLMPPHAVYIETHLGGGAVLRHKRPARRSIGIDLDKAVVHSWRSARLKDCTIIQADAAEFLREYAFTGQELIYADPPYLPETRRKKRIYRHEYTVDQHIELLDVLRAVDAAVLISGYASPLYDDRLRDWRRVDFMGDSHVGPRMESVWLNFEPTASLHDYGHIGASFRERERIRRKQMRLAQRISSLPEEERHALFDTLARSHPAALKHALDASP
jgi:DNA adenine methylase